MKKKLVLAFSGGLDTSFCVSYLSKEKHFEVHTVTVNTGGFTPQELKALSSKALHLGAHTHTNIDRTKAYYDEVIKFLIFGNMLKNNTYPLSVSAERTCQALAVAQFADKIKASAIAHGSTGAGNDQVRFDLVFQTIVPHIEIITPIRDKKLSRAEEIQYLHKNGNLISAEKANYSINKGLWGTSIGGVETLTSMGVLPEQAYTKPLTQTNNKEVSIVFQQGEPVQIDNKVFTHPSKAIQYLEKSVEGYGIGRDIHVGDTVIGIKGRVAFEAAAPMLIIKAHHLLEKHTLTKWQLSWKDTLAHFYGTWLHEGQYMDPVMRNIEAFLTSTQTCVSGRVCVRIKPQHFELLGVESPYDLMQARFGRYGEENNSWTGEDVKGFAKIFGNQTMISHQVKEAARKRKK